MTSTDVIIIGAGPVGLFAIFECGMLKLSCHVIDALDVPGGQCAALYPEKPIYDIPALPCVTGQELVDNLLKQASPFHPVFHLNQQVQTVQKTDLGFRVKTSIGTVLEAKAILIAAGVGAFGPHRPPLENLEAFEGKSVFYRIGNRQEFAGKTLCIAGGGDSALDWAVNLAPIAQKIYMIHRRPKFRGAPETVARMEALAKEGRIELVIPYQLDALKGKEGKLSAVSVVDMKGEKRWLEADILLPFFGLSMDLGPIAEWGLNLDKSHISVDSSSQETSTPGIFAIGDVATYLGKLKLILTGFAEAARAAHSIYALVYPGQVLHFEYSTTKGIPVT